MKNGKILHPKNQQAFSLIECILPAVVLMIVIISIITFRYYTVADVDHAENQLLAARSAYLLSEAWKGQRVDPHFDPVDHHFQNGFEVENITSSALLAQAPIGSQTEKLHKLANVHELGIYRLVIDQKPFIAELFYGDISGVENLKGIHVLIVWSDQRGRRCEYYMPTLSQG